MVTCWREVGGGLWISWIMHCCALGRLCCICAWRMWITAVQCSNFMVSVRISSGLQVNEFHGVIEMLVRLLK